MTQRTDPFDGFAEFFAARRHALSRAAMFLTGDPTVAEDVFQEAMARAAARWPSVSKGGDPEGYVRAIMLNQVRDSWRKSKLFHRFAPRLLEDRLNGTREASDQHMDLWTAVRSLTPGQRAVLYFRYYLDYTEAQTAAALGCSVGTVKSQNHRALQALRHSNPSLLRAHVESGSE